MKKSILISIIILITNSVFAQVKDTSEYKLDLRKIVIPASLMVFGFTQIGHESKELQTDLQEDFPFFKSRLDDVAQYVPLGAVLISGSLGLATKNNFKNRFIYSVISYTTVGITVNVLKKTIKETRPDNSGNNSFPSGHTAFSFTGAEIFHQELKDSHPVLSYAAYPLAAGVGVYRMLNNKHYLSDVLVGASLGILSTKLAYSIYHPKKVEQKDKLSLSFTPSQVLGKNGFLLSAKF